MRTSIIHGIFLYALTMGTGLVSAELPPPVSVLVTSDYFLKTSMSADPELATSALVDGETPAQRVTVLQGQHNFWEAQMTMPVKQKVAKGDLLYLTFRLRTIEVRNEVSQGSAVVFFQRSSSPWEKSIVRTAEAGLEWQQFAYAFHSDHDFAPGESAMVFGFGEREEIVEIAEVRLVNYGTTVALADLPLTLATYKGREPDAAWRTAADERIDRIRKSDVTILVTDPTGKPLPDAKVELRMKRHAFYFGTAVSIAKINDPSPDGERYRETVKELFNHIVTENALKWPALTGDWNATGVGSLMDGLTWLKQQGLHMKGHVLVWPSFKHMGKSVEPLKDQPEKLREAIADHVTDLTSKHRGILDEWDVINEPFDNHDAMDILGREVMVDWFKLAKKGAPDARLYINDYGILSAGGATNTKHQAHYEETIRFLQQNGAPLEGIGLQSHFGENVTPPDVLMEILDRFAGFGVPLQVTEFDVDTNDETLLGDYTRDFMTLVFSHSAVNGFVMWGFWEGAHWRPQSAMFRRDWSERPNATAYRDLVFEKWWTEVDGTTGADGKFSTRGFLGDYVVKVGEIEREFQLTQDGATVEVKLP
jgi:GH35 family endo-1,4-beta-xylanase